MLYTVETEILVSLGMVFRSLEFDDNSTSDILEKVHGFHCKKKKGIGNNKWIF